MIKPNTNLDRFAFISGSVVLCIGLMGLLGWVTGMRELASLHPAYVPISPDTSLGFILLGLIVLINVRPQYSRGSTIFVSCIVACVSFYGLLKFAEYFLNIDLTLESILFPVTETIGSFTVKRMSPLTGILFFVSGSALLIKIFLVNRRNTPNVISSIGLFTLAVGFIAIVGYLYGTPLLYGGNVIPLAAPTAMGFIFLGCGLISIAGMQSFFVRPFIGSLANARLLRVLLPLFVSAILIQGFLDEMLARAFNINEALITALLSLIFAAITAVVVVQLSRIIFRRADEADADRRQAEESLRESEERFDKFMANLPAVVFMKDQESRLLYANPTLKDLFGWHEAVGKLSSELLPPELARQMVADDKRVLENGPVVVHEKVMDAHGEEHFFETHKFPFYKKNGEILLGGISIDETERKRAEEELRQNQESYRKLFEDHSAVKLILDIDTGFILDANHAAAQYYGWSRGELKQMKIDQINTLSPEEVKREMEKVRRNRRIQFEFRHRRADGSVRDVEVFTSKIEMMGKDVLHSIVHDITERKLAEKALRESEEKFRLLLNSTAEAIYGIDLDGNCTFCNTACLQLLGYNHPGELLGKNMHWQMHSKHADGTPIPIEECRVFKAFKKGENSHVDDEVFWKADGTWFPAEYWSYPQFRDGKILGSVVTFLDITERKWAEDLLATQKRRLSDILEGTNVGTWEWDVQTGETKYNDRWAEMIGYTLEELSPVSIDTWRKFAHPDDLQKSGELVEKHFRGELEYYECEARMRHKNGNWIWVLDRGKVASWTNDGKPRMMSGTHQDITQRKIAEVERENLIKDLQSALDNVKTLQGLIPICANCKKIRDDTGYWQQVEGYIQKHSDIKFSHGICPECALKLYPEYVKNKK